ncbi:MAG: HNH endonuclease [Kangiellaceae bacterium]|nr:HNH endonuclease [Kangiellaceae bacterium]
MQTQILRLNKAGQAMQWIGLEAAACLYARDQIVWTYGEKLFRLHGGVARISGLQTILDIASVIATKGKVCRSDSQTPRLCNASLFQRDKGTCMYFGHSLSRALLTRDHIIPQARGGLDSWENCITACKSCNNHKGCRTPEEAGMRLLAIPFRPNKSEYLALANRSILVDQMDFLVKGFSRNMRKRQL